MNDLADIPSIEEYYAKHAAAYASVSLDRDITSQAAELMALVGHDRSPIRYLELFAGPAYHALAMQTAPGWECFAIDTSGAMKNEAIKRGFAAPDRYAIGSVTDVEALFAAAAPFDLIAAPRYSVGHLSRPAFHEMLGQVARLLRPGGVFFVELHRIDLFVGGFGGLGIRERHSIDNGVETVCRWPAGPVRMQADEFLATMRVELEIRPPDADPVEVAFESREIIYSRGEADQAVTIVGLTPSHDALSDVRLRHAFPDSIVALYRKEP